MQKPQLSGLGGFMEFTDFMWYKLIAVAVIFFLAGLFGFLKN
jgi:hypothetical protein